MELVETAEEIMLRESARKLLETKCPPSLVRVLQESGSSGHDPDLWQALAATGWIGLAVPEKYGGSGATLYDLGSFFRESGRVLLPSDYASTQFATLLICSLGTDSQRDHYLPAICRGEVVATVAFLEPELLHDWSRVATVARGRPGGRWELTGTKSFVPNASVADVMVVLARCDQPGTAGSLGAFLVEPRQSGPSLVIDPLCTFARDRQAEVSISGLDLAPTALLGEPEQLPSTEGRFAEVVDTMTALQSMEMAGGIERVVELTAAYVTSRIQFGRPIGSFQAVQHHVADMGIQSEGALLLAAQAVSLLSRGEPATRAISHAKAWVNRAYPAVTVMAHQVWGGMGYVRDTDLHLYSARAKAAQVSFGTSDHHWGRTAKAFLA